MELGSVHVASAFVSPTARSCPAPVPGGPRGVAVEIWLCANKAVMAIVVQSNDRLISRNILIVSDVRRKKSVTAVSVVSRCVKSRYFSHVQGNTGGIAKDGRLLRDPRTETAPSESTSKRRAKATILAIRYSLIATAESNKRQMVNTRNLAVQIHLSFVHIANGCDN